MHNVLKLLSWSLSRNLVQTTDQTQSPGDLLLLWQGQAGQHGEFHQGVDEPSWDHQSRQWNLVCPYWRRWASAEWLAATGGNCLNGGRERVVGCFDKGTGPKGKAAKREEDWWTTRTGGSKNCQRDPYLKLVSSLNFFLWDQNKNFVTSMILNDVIILAAFSSPTSFVSWVISPIPKFHEHSGTSLILGLLKTWRTKCWQKLLKPGRWHWA